MRNPIVGASGPDGHKRALALSEGMALKIVNQISTGWRWLFILAALEAGAALIALASIPRETAGYSLARLTMLTVLGGLILLWSLLAARPPRVLAAQIRIRVIVGCAAVTLFAGATIFLLRHLGSDTLSPYYERARVLLWYILALGAQFLFYLLLVRFGLHLTALREWTPMVLPAGLAFAALLLTLGFIAATRLGITPDSAYWGEPGVPITGWQLALAALGGLGGLILVLRFHWNSRLDALVAAALWLAAAVIWLSVPVSVMRNSFYAPIRPPTDQPFPNSDAGYYDSMAQSLLIGHPYLGEIPARPLYIVALAALHSVVGERYDLIIAGQTLVLAFIPVVLYLLGRKLHSPGAGIIRRSDRDLPRVDHPSRFLTDSGIELQDAPRGPAHAAAGYHRLLGCRALAAEKGLPVARFWREAYSGCCCSFEPKLP